MEEKVIEIAKKKCEGADLEVTTSYNISVNYLANQLDSISSNESFRLGLRIIKDNRIGISYTLKKDYDPNELVERAITNSLYGPKCFFNLPEKNSYVIPKKSDESIKKLTAMEMKEFLEKETKKIIKKDTSVSGGIYKGESITKFLNSNGVEYTNLSRGASVALELQKRDEGNFLTLYNSKNTRKFPGDLKNVAKEIQNDYLLSKKLKKIETKEYDIYFDREIVEEILDILLLGLNGKNVMLGTSPLANYLGEKRFDERISIYEDPHLDFGQSSTGIDDEGVATYKKDLIKDGVIQTFFYDLQTAGKTKNISTGNGFRSINGQASPSLTNVVLQGGLKSTKKIISEVQDGIYLKSIMGGFTNNPHTGDMSVNVDLAFKIEEGKFVGRVKDAMIFFNIFDIFQNKILEISKEQEWKGDMLLPGILFSKISVASD